MVGGEQTKRNPELEVAFIEEKSTLEAFINPTLVVFKKSIGEWMSVLKELV